jgi:beta-glucanase (GH16 family)
VSSAAGAQNWELSWHDEFNGAAGTAIDSKKWQFERGDLKVNDELEYYCAPTDPAPCDPANPNASLDGSGHLLIQALRVSGGTAPGSNAWTSARLNTANDRASFRYGRIESRMQLPTGPGIWPAFWAMGTNVGTVDWPTCGEMDFMENVPLVGHLGPKVVKSTIHGPGYSGGHGLGKDYSLSTDVTEFHSYGAIWSPFMVQFYVDDPANVFFIRTPRDLPAGKEWVYEHPFFLLLNLAVGGIGSWPGPPDASTPNPARMVVDYVRVYKAEPIAVPSFAAPAAIDWKNESDLKVPIKLTAKLGSGRMYVTCLADDPGVVCSITAGDELNDAVADFKNKASVPLTLRVSTPHKTRADASDDQPKAFAVRLRAYTLSSDPDNPKTYSEVRIPVRIRP